ncbi:Type II restriction enzyme, methylase subunit YeeA [Arcticibacter svalbardensis MN12-7]|uniref:Type II restriction enzyme, methylase subunit YeeA n=1 Tax=Arcticibacter svalbardensis MN12-7 TaxID=1150600 RepID=R9GPV7_9SPHI|nr:Type II restriction enzyme, methylase subunit YeeA [Arcticibacter svalbardensis MN12-7]
MDIDPNKLQELKEIEKRVKKVKNIRSESTRVTTQKLADYPQLFGEIRQPKSNYILIPRHSSENRKYIPLGFLTPDFIVSDSCLSIDNASIYHFGILHSEMHMAWVKSTCGRIKSDFRYSNEIVYNNFPWPKENDKNAIAIESAAQHILDVRQEFSSNSLSSLYDPLIMPPKLIKAHKALDKAVDLAYRKQPFLNEANRVVYLFDLYEKYSADLFSTGIIIKKVKASKLI